MKPKKSYIPNNKKASLEISITAVVVLIIAIVMLGLALGFIRTFFGGTVGELEEITQQLGEQTRNELLASPQQITFLTSRINVVGREKDLSFAIRNVRQNDIVFKITTQCFDAIGPESLRASAQAFVGFATFQTAEVEGGKSDVLPLKITMDAAATPTIYKCEMILDIEEEFTKDPVTGQKTPLASTSGGITQYARKLFEIDYKK